MKLRESMGKHSKNRVAGSLKPPSQISSFSLQSSNKRSSISHIGVMRCAAPEFHVMNCLIALGTDNRLHKSMIDNRDGSKIDM